MCEYMCEAMGFDPTCANSCGIDVTSLQEKINAYAEPYWQNVSDAYTRIEEWAAEQASLAAAEEAAMQQIETALTVASNGTITGETAVDTSVTTASLAEEIINIMET